MASGDYAGMDALDALRARVTADAVYTPANEIAALVGQVVGSVIDSEILGHLVASDSVVSREDLGALLEVIDATGDNAGNFDELESALVRFAEVYGA